MQAEVPEAEIVRYADERGMFFAFLFDRSKWRRSELPEQLARRAHILEVLLADASECWVYGLSEKSDYLRIMTGKLKPVGGKFAVDPSPDSVARCEAFWDCTAGDRGSIIILIPQANLRPERIFPLCHLVGVMGNPSAGHTPAAFRYAQFRVESEELIAFCFPRNSSCDTMNIVAGKGRTSLLFSEALRLCNRVAA